MLKLWRSFAYNEKCLHFMNKVINALLFCAGGVLLLLMLSPILMAWKFSVEEEREINNCVAQGNSYNYCYDLINW